jgi:hypothetical protein
MQKKYHSKERSNLNPGPRYSLNLKSGVYVIRGTDTLVVFVKENHSNPPYLASKPNLNLKYNPSLAEHLEIPTEEQKAKFLADPTTLLWLTEQVGRGPNIRKTIDDFLEVSLS